MWEAETLKPGRQKSGFGSFLVWWLGATLLLLLTGTGGALAASSVSLTSVTPSPTTASSSATYTVNLTTTSALTGGSGTITLQSVAPLQGQGGSQFPSVAAAYVITDLTNSTGGTVSATPVLTNSNSSVTFTVPNGIGAGDHLSVAVSGVLNPSAGTYTLSAFTSADLIPASYNYNITAPPGASVSGLSASPSPATAGSLSNYTVDFTTSATGSLVAPTDTITVVGPPGTIFPGSNKDYWASSGGMTTYSGYPPLVSDGGDTVQFTAPVGVGDNAAVALTVYNVLNPLVGGQVAMQVYTSADTLPATSGSYTVSASSGSSVSGLGVMVNPATSGSAATYTVSFTATSALTGGSGTITLGSVPPPGATGTQFPSTAASYAITDSSHATGSGAVSVTPTLSNSDSTVTFTVPNGISVGDQLSVAISGAQNPASDYYWLQASTSADTAPATVPYTIQASGGGSSVSGLGVTVSPLTAGATAAYTVSFTAAGALTGGLGTVTLQSKTVPTGSPGTPFPATAASYAITDTTHATGSGAVSVTPTLSNSDSTVTFTVPANVSAGDQLSVAIDGVQNPAAGTYSLQVSTSADTTPATTSYTINQASSSGSSISGLAVTVNPATAGATAIYSVNLTATNAVASGSGTVTLESVPPVGSSGSRFPSAAADYVITDPTHSAGSGTVSATPVLTNSGATVTFTVPGSISAGDQLSVAIGGVQNPTDTGNYSLQASTSSDATPVSAAYAIELPLGGSTVSGVGVTLGDYTVGAASSYTVDFTATSGLAVGSAVYLAYPNGTGLASGLAGADISLNGYTVTGTVTVTGTTLYFPSPVQVSSGGTVAVEVKNDGSGHEVTNPTAPGSSYTLQVHTTADSTPVSSSAYTLNPGTASQLVFTVFSSQESSGGSFGLSLTAEDPYGNTATGYTGTVHFSTTDGSSPNGTAPVLPGDYTFTAGTNGDNGSHIFSGFTLYKATTATITATDTVTWSLTGSSSITVNAVPATHLSVAATSPETAGTPFDATVTALDQYGNTDTGYTGKVRFTSSDGAAYLPPDYTFTTGTGGDNGTHTFTKGVTLATTGSQTVTVTDTGNGSITGATGALTVNSVPSPISVTAAAGDGQTALVGTAFGTDLAVGVTDGYGNPISGASVVFTAPISNTGPGGLETQPGGIWNVGGQKSQGEIAGTFNGTTYTAPELNADDTAGPLPVTAAVTVGTVSRTVTFNLTITPEAPATITISGGNDQSAELGQGFGTALSALVQDVYGNPVPGVTVTFTAPGTGARASFAGSGASAAVETDSNGIATAPNLTASQTGGLFPVTAQTGQGGAELSTTFQLADANTLLTNCDPTSLEAAVAAGGVIGFSCSGTVNFPQSPPPGQSVGLLIPAGANVTIEGLGQRVVLTSQYYQLFAVEGGTLDLTNLNIENCLVTGPSGSEGKAGKNGKPGAAGSSSRGGGGGGAGPAGNGANAEWVQAVNTDDYAPATEGGAIYIAAGSNVVLNEVAFSNNAVVGAEGGPGGPGGYGGGGGTGADGKAGKGSAKNGGGGGWGFGGGAPSYGGTGGDGSAGGDARGGAIYNLGNLTIQGGIFNADLAEGGQGGFGGGGGSGGSGGDGGQGGQGGYGGNGYGGDGGSGGPGTSGANGGAGGWGAPGGWALGGSIYNGGTLSISNSTLDDYVQGGAGGGGGGAGWGGPGGGSVGGQGGWGYNGKGGNGGPGGSGGKGGNASAEAGSGGPGGAAQGGNIYNTGSLTITDSTLTGTAAGGFGGRGGGGGAGGQGAGGGGGMGGSGYLCQGGQAKQGCQGGQWVFDGGSTGLPGGRAQGGDGGIGGDGGVGGLALGGAIFTTDAVTLNGVTFGGGFAGGAAVKGGDGGAGGAAGLAGDAGDKYHGNPGALGGAGTAGTAVGADVYTAPPAPPVVIDTTSLTGEIAEDPGNPTDQYQYQQLQAEGGTEPYFWSVVAGSLPPGQELDQAAGVIEGIPYQAGAYLFTIQVTDRMGQTATKALSLLVSVDVAATGSSNGSSSSPGGSATAGGQGSDTPDTQATATGGQGSVAVGEYAGNPNNGTTFQSTGEYFDVAVSQGASFQSVTVQECGLSPGDIVYWSPDGTTWQPVSPQSPVDASGCVTLGPFTNVSPASSPTLAQLNGTPFGIGAKPLPLVGNDRLSFQPFPIASPGALTPGQSVDGAVYARGPDGSAVVGATVYLSTGPGFAGTALAEGTPLSSTPQAFTTDSYGSVPYQYTAPTILPSGVTATIAASATGTGSGPTATGSYTFATIPIASLTLNPTPLAADGSLSGGEAVGGTLLARGGNGQPVIDGTVYLSFAPATGGGMVTVGGTALSTTPEPFTTDRNGQVGFTYTVPAQPPNSGSDVLTAASDDTPTPTVSARAGYVYASLAPPVYPSTVTISAVPSGLAAGASATISGQVLAADGSAFAYAPVELSASAGTLGASTVRTGSDGSYSTTFTMPSPAVPVVATVSIQGNAETVLQSLIIAPPGVTVTGTTGSPSVDGTATAGGGKVQDTEVTASGGDGTVTVGDYGENPVGTPAPSGTGAYFDVNLSARNSFTQLTIVRSGVGDGTPVYWWDAAASGGAGAWQQLPASEVQYDTPAAGEITVTLTDATTPALSDLTGTPFAVQIPAVVGSAGSAGRLPSVSVGTAGGLLATPDGSFQATVPAGWLPANAELTLTEENSASGLPTSMSPASPLFNLTGPAFSGSLPVTVRYNPAALGGLSPERLSIYLQGSGGAWSFVPTTVYADGTVQALLRGPGSLVVLANTEEFSDLPTSHWARPAIRAMLAAGILNGFPDGTFRPETAVSRAEFVKMLVLTLGLTPQSGPSTFDDVAATDWFAPYVNAAVSAGLVQGVSTRLFAPDQTLTREEMAVLLTRALGLPGVTATASISDASGIDPWAAPGVGSAVAAGYLRGFPDGDFRPLDPATRAQAAQVLRTVLGQNAGTGGEYLRAYTTSGTAVTLDLAQAPVLLFAWWCPHCQAILPDIAKLPPDRRPILIDTYYKGNDEIGDVQAELQKAGLAGAAYYVLASPPATVTGVPTVLYWQQGQRVMAVGQSAVAAWAQGH